MTLNEHRGDFQFALQQPLGRLLDDVVGRGEQLAAPRCSTSLCRLQVDDELEFGRLHYRKYGGLGTLKYSAGIDADLTECSAMLVP